ncbi:MAG: hypothetical protein HYW26_01420 [Candidatus Aenigmarchaeota archaeon]|nr:hypothetical protein [Candidatus Aenigmarchaeota archaeon]
MVFSYVEDITEAWCRNNGYLTQRNFPLRIKRESKKQFGWSDIDVLASNKKETLIINCKNWIHQNGVRKLISDMNIIGKKFSGTFADELNMPKTIKKIFVVDIWNHKDKFDREFDNSGIEKKELKELLEELSISLAKDFIKRDHYSGKETNAVSRILLTMWYNKLMSDELKAKVYDEYIEKLKDFLRKKPKSSKRSINSFLNSLCINKGKEIERHNKEKYNLRLEEKKFIINRAR